MLRRGQRRPDFSPRTSHYFSRGAVDEFAPDRAGACRCARDRAACQQLNRSIKNALRQDFFLRSVVALQDLAYNYDLLTEEQFRG